MVLVVDDTGDRSRGNWTSDSGASRHPVNEDALLIDLAEWDHEIAIVDC